MPIVPSRPAGPMNVYFSPETVRTVALVVLNVALTAYLLRVPRGAGAPRWLAGFTAGTVGLYLCRAVEASLVPLADGALWAIKSVEAVVVTVALGALVQFAYRFLEAPYEREGRALLVVAVLWAGGVAAFALSLYGAGTEVRDVTMTAYSLTWLLADTWAAVVLLRKRRRALADDRARDARAYAAFAAVCGVDALALVTIIASMGLPDDVGNLVWVFGVLPAIFAIHYARVAIYIEHAPEPTSLRAKLSGLTLAIVLAVIGMTAVLLGEPLNPNISGGVPLTVESARDVHGAMVRLFGLMAVATAVALVAVPWALRGSLVGPVARLLDGVRRVNAGEREVTVPVGVRDEVGRLTEGFNAMTASLAAAEADLRAHARDLERRVEARTAELVASKAEVEAQADRLQEMDRLKTRFFANVSHEFRTPLTLLLGPIEDARAGRYGDLDPGLEAQLPVMERNARRLLALINQLLDLAKLEAGGLDLDRRPADLADLARGVVATFASRAERGGVALLLDGPTALAAELDAPKVEGVLTNLLANALAFTEPGGKVRVGLEARGGEAVLTVEDTGVGIAAESLPHVFDRFRQVDGSATRTHEGTGIGLALAKELVEMHGGTIAVESAVGFGTRFTVRLPRGAGGAVGPAEAEVVVAAPDDLGGDGTAPAPPGDDRPVVLVVEDNADLRAFVRGHLADRYRVVEAPDGAAGLEAARAHAPALVLSDVMMPEMDGVALTRALKADASLSDVPVVLLTARADEASVLGGLEAGADDYLAKPFSPAELRARVDNAVAARRQMRERYSDEVVVGPSRVVVPSAEAAFLEAVRDAAEAHLGDDAFGVERLAEAVGLSRRQLTRRLKDALGTAPGAFLRELRLARAAQLLGQGAGTVAEVAYAVGYRDPEHFSKQFRKAFGVTPSAYVEQA